MHIDNFMKGEEVSRIEIIFAHLTVTRNLSFNLSETYGKCIPHMFLDSRAAEDVVLNRHKVKNIIELVLVTAIYLKRMKSIAVKYFDEKLMLIKRIVFEILEQNSTKAKDIYDSLIETLKKIQVNLKNVISIMTDNAADMVGRENGCMCRDFLPAMVKAFLPANGARIGTFWARIFSNPALSFFRSKKILFKNQKISKNDRKFKNLNTAIFLT